MIPPSSRADSRQAVLVLIDLQDRLARTMPGRERVLSRAALLVEAAAIASVPVVVTRQYPQGLGDLDERIVPALDTARAQCAVNGPIDKLAFNCFAEPAFAATLSTTGRRQLVICGMETHICVAQTALAALDEGYDVHVVEDACSSRDPRDHEVASARMRAAGVVVTSAESVAYELIERAGTDAFKALLRAVKALG